MKKILTATMLVLTLSWQVFAHEYWLEPERFFLSPGEKTPVHLYVGDGLIKDREKRVYQPEKTTLFQLLSTNSVLDLKPVTKDGVSPVHEFSATREGRYLLGMERNWSYIKLGPEQFEDYLREDGMEYIIAERAERGERKNEGRERYSRFLKSLLKVGDKSDSVYKKELGLKLEIVPLEDPYKKRVGDTLKFRILFDKKPLAGRVVFADNRDAETQKMTTDAKGIATLKLTKPDLWLVRLVFMQRCKKDCGEADWESFWSAFTFGVK